MQLIPKSHSCALLLLTCACITVDFVVVVVVVVVDSDYSGGESTGVQEGYGLVGWDHSRPMLPTS